MLLIEKKKVSGGKGFCLLRIKTHETDVSAAARGKKVVVERGKALEAFRAGLKHWVPLLRTL